MKLRRLRSNRTRFNAFYFPFTARPFLRVPSPPVTQIDSIVCYCVLHNAIITYILRKSIIIQQLVVWSIKKCLGPTFTNYSVYQFDPLYLIKVNNFVVTYLILSDNEISRAFHLEFDWRHFSVTVWSLRKFSHKLSSNIRGTYLIFRDLE